MSIFLLDSNIVMSYLNNRDGRSVQLKEWSQQGIRFASTSIVFTEVYMGMRPQEETITGLFLNSLKFYPVTQEIAQLAGNLYSHWRTKGHTLGLPDVTIAAVCIANGLTLVSSNQKHFPMAELKLLALPARL
jgi:predicted nucleic acid-binding protein